MKKIQVQKIEGEEYYLENGVFEHACKVIPPKFGQAVCDCGKLIVDDFDYSDEDREERYGR